MSTPIVFECFPEGLKPLKRFANIYGAEYEPGKLYTLVPVEDRSSASHKHFFASVHDLWLTLPDEMIAERFPSADVLRQWALIKSGFCDVRTYVAATKAEAARVAQWSRPKDYAIVTVRDCVVTEYTAKSQKYRAMKKEDFQASKDAVFRVIAELLGTTPEQAKAA